MRTQSTKTIFSTCVAAMILATMPSAHAKKTKNSDDVLGTYKIISTKYGIDRAIAKAYKDKKGSYYFKITKVIKSGGIEDITHCQNCPGKFKDKPVEGMIVVWNLKPSKKNPYSFKGGYGISPWSGRMFRGDLKMNSSKKLVRIKAYPLGTKVVSRSFNFIRIDGKK